MSHASLSSARWKSIHSVGTLCLGTVAVGAVWRVVRYLAGFPIWGDEAMLLVNLIDRDYLELMSPLGHAQVAPLLFLWAEKTVLLATGPAEQWVRLVPFLAGLAGLFVFWQACRASLSPGVAGLALAILAVSYYPIRHSVEVKPYALDLLFAAMFIWLALGHLRQQGSTRWLTALTVLAPVAMWWSYPAVFVAAAAAVVLLPRMRTSPWRERGLYLLFLLLLCGSFFLHYGLVGLEQLNGGSSRATSQFLDDYWRNAFPPDRVADWPFWLIKTFTGNMLAYPTGGKNGGSTLTFLLTVIGTVALWRRARHGTRNARSLLALCWLPVAFTLVAAFLRRYPFGDSARVSLHMAPSIVILMAIGLDQAINWSRSQTWRSRWRAGVFVSLLVFGAAGVARDVATPYKTTHDREVRELVRDMSRDIDAGEPLRLCHRSYERIPTAIHWYIRTHPWDSSWMDAPLREGAASYWVLRCGAREPADGDMLACLGEPADGWAVADRRIRAIPPHNAVTPTLYCGWSRLVRAP